MESTHRIITPSKEVFTQEEVQSILADIENTKNSILYRIDGNTWYSIDRAKNNPITKQAQYTIYLHTHYGMYNEGFTYTYSYIETLAFLRTFRVIEII